MHIYFFYRQPYIPNGSHAPSHSGPYAGGSMPPIQTHGVQQQQALPPLN